MAQFAIRSFENPPTQYQNQNHFALSNRNEKHARTHSLFFSAIGIRTLSELLKCEKREEKKAHTHTTTKKRMRLSKFNSLKKINQFLCFVLFCLRLEFDFDGDGGGEKFSNGPHPTK